MARVLERNKLKIIIALAITTSQIILQTFKIFKITQPNI